MIDRFVEQQHTNSSAIGDAIKRLLTQVRQYMAPADIERVGEALQLLCESFQLVPGGEPAKEQGLAPGRLVPPLEQALAVSLILAQTHIDAVGVAAGLVFEAVDADRLALERVSKVLGGQVAFVVGSMLRLNILERKKQSVIGTILSSQATQEETGSGTAAESKKPRIREALRRQQAEAVRKMFVAMAEDPRVVVLKLAYRLHAIRLIGASLSQIDRQETLTMAQETQEIYAPLAGRLGMSRVESELQDLAFKILEPEKYLWISEIIEEESKQWRSYVDRVCEILRKEMTAVGVKAEVSGRVKHLYSFYKKLERNAGDVGALDDLKKAADISQIHDLIAFRILVESTQDCYVALGHVHSMWKPKEGRIKDFVANPKPNGYQALHTTVFCLDNQLVEIQIRTHAMHEIAEYGVAMHWHYKDVGDGASANARELLTWLRQMNEWQSEIRSSNASDTEFVDAVKDDIFQEQIFVFTPKGEVKDLPVGSTPLDFAYRIHTKVGDSCAGARVITHVGNGEVDRLVTRMVPLDYELKSGEIVDIVTNRSAHPTRDWLHFARTAAARSKIRRYLKIHERDINMQIGRERLERELKIAGARTMEAMTEDLERWLCEEFRQEQFDDILAAVGSDDIRARAVAVKVAEYWQARESKDGKDGSRDEEETVRLPAINPKTTSAANLQVAGVEGLLTRLANCCYPLPGDQIIGYVTRGKGVMVHRTDCPNIALYREREPERLVPVHWLGMSQSRYLVPIVLTANDRPGLMRDIATVVSDMSLNLVSVNFQVNTRWETVTFSLTVEVPDLDYVQRLFMRLGKIKDVVHVERDLGKRK